MTWEQQYLDILKELLEKGTIKANRTEISTRYLFGRSIRVENVAENFPLLTTKKVFFRGVVEELLFFLRGETDTKILEEKGINIWKGNTKRSFLDQHESSHVNHFPEGLMGPGYSWQFRNFGASYEYNDQKKCSNGYYNFDQKMYSEGFDQVQYVIDCLKTDPNRRDMVISLWNPPQHKDAVLPPCHVLYVFSYEPETNQLHLSMTQRSCDFFLGVPFNIASCATFLTIMAQIGNMKVGDLLWHGTDIHLYENQTEAAKEQLKRKPRSVPQMSIEQKIGSTKDIEELQYEDFVISGYDPQSTIKADMVP